MYYDSENLSSYKSPTGSPRRPKRFIGTIIASLLASIGVSSIFGSINSGQINTLREGLKSSTEKQALIIHALEEDSESITTNRNMISQLQDLTIKITKYTEVQHFETNGLLVYVLMSTEFSRLHLALDQFMNIIEASQHHKFEPSILTKEGATAAFEEIKALAETRGLIPVIRNAQQFSQLETNFHMTAKGVNLIINIPLASEETTFTLHRYNALPIMLGSEVFAKLKPDNNLLAIGESEASGHPRYVELSSTDLAMCNKLGKVYLCNDQRIIRRPAQYSCLYALFIGDHRPARDVCQLTLESKKWDQVVSTSSDTFLYYSVTPSSFVYQCQNQSVIRGRQLTSITEIQIPESCRVQTSNFILHRRNDLYRDATPQRWKWTLAPLSFLENDNTIVDLNSAVKTLDKMKGVPRITPDTIERLKQLNKPFYISKTISGGQLPHRPVRTIVGIILNCYYHLPGLSV